MRKALGDDAICPGFIATHMTEVHAARLDRFPVISGHISMADVKRFFPDRMILTILRDPVDRCLSWYYFARKSSTGAFSSDFVEAKRKSVEEFFALDQKLIYRNIYNRQVRQLGDHALNFNADLERAMENAKETLRSAVWVGRQESLSADLKRLGDLVPELAGLELTSFNVTGDRKQQDELSPELIARIRSLNEYDLKLYAFAAQDAGAPA